MSKRIRFAIVSVIGVIIMAVVIIYTMPSLFAVVYFRVRHMGSDNEIMSITPKEYKVETVGKESEQYPRLKYYKLSFCSPWGKGTEHSKNEFSSSLLFQDKVVALWPELEDEFPKKEMNIILSTLQIVEDVGE